jgi:hypothetical protein
MSAAVDSQKKTCRLCGETKPTSEYYVNTSGNLRSECKSCKRKASLRRHEIGPVLREPRKQTGLFKLCRTCGVDKDTSEFAVDRARSDGLHSQCRTCKRESWRDYARSRAKGRKND